MSEFENDIWCLDWHIWSGFVTNDTWFSRKWQRIYNSHEHLRNDLKCASSTTWWWMAYLDDVEIARLARGIEFDTEELDLFDEFPHLLFVVRAKSFNLLLECRLTVRRLPALLSLVRPRRLKLLRHKVTNHNQARKTLNCPTLNCL